jgi:hypothetical protein
MERTIMYKFHQFACALAILAFSITGCSFIYNERKVSEKGINVQSSTTFQQIEIGKTTKEWLIAAVGEPTSITNAGGDNKVEILKYTYELTKSSEFGVFITFSQSNVDTVRKTNSYFEFQHGILTRHWVETEMEISDSLLEQIKVGKTTEAWLVSNLGNPTSRTMVASGKNQEILKYLCKRTASSSTSFAFVFSNTSNDTSAPMSFCFEVDNGIITRFWTEE